MNNTLEEVGEIFFNLSFKNKEYKNEPLSILRNKKYDFKKSPKSKKIKNKTDYEFCNSAFQINFKKNNKKCEIDNKYQNKTEKINDEKFNKDFDNFYKKFNCIHNENYEKTKILEEKMIKNNLVNLIFEKNTKENFQENKK